MYMMYDKKRNYYVKIYVKNIYYVLNKSHRNSYKNVKSTTKGAGAQRWQAHSFTVNRRDHILKMEDIRFLQGLLFKN